MDPHRLEDTELLAGRERLQSETSYLQTTLRSQEQQLRTVIAQLRVLVIELVSR